MLLKNAELLQASRLLCGLIRHQSNPVDYFIILINLIDKMPHNNIIISLNLHDFSVAGVQGGLSNNIYFQFKSEIQSLIFMSKIVLDCLIICLTTFSQLQTLPILQKYISIYFARLNMSIQPTNRYQNIIQILESDDDQPNKPTVTPPKQLIPKQNNERKPKIYQTPNLGLSNSSLHSLQSTGCASYDDILSFRDLQLTSNLNQHYCSIKQFLQYTHKNVLFIFGPSGCGKTLLTLSLLEQNRLHFEIAQERMEENQYGDSVAEEYIEMLYRMMLSVDKIREKIIVFKDFPISGPEMPQSAIQKHKIFKENVHRLISDISNRNKYIFILNTQIYSSFYILSEASEQKAINRLNNVSVIKMESYGLREMQKIINKFTTKYHSYSTITNNSKLLEDIISQANGDARKALNIIFHKKLKENRRLLQKTYPQPSQIHFFQENCQQKSISIKSASSFGFGQVRVNKQQQGQEKQQLKYSVFHTLGKFLYGKRYNIYYNPNIKKNKKTNDVSCYYTEQQIEKLNPPFYFRPTQLFQKSQMDLRIFVELLQQNFLGRFGKVKDIANMYSIFRYFDSYLQDGISKFEIKEQLQEHLKEMVTWGIVVYNKNTVRDNTFHAFQRSKNNISKKLLQNKLQIIKTYYERYKTPQGSMKHKIKDIISYGLQLRSVNPKNVQNFHVFLQKLVEIIIQNGKKNINYQSNTIQKEMNIMEDEDEMLGTENCSRLNKISDILGKQVNHKSKLISMMLEDSDESDIDSEN